jgi:hypothetical protein
MGLTEQELHEQELKEARAVITLGTQESESEQRDSKITVS